MAGLPDDSMVTVLLTIVSDYPAKKRRDATSTQKSQVKDAKDIKDVSNENTGYLERALDAVVYLADMTGKAVSKVQNATTQTLYNVTPQEVKIKICEEVYPGKIKQAFQANTMEAWLDVLSYFGEETRKWQGEKCGGGEAECAQMTAAVASYLRHKLRKNLPNADAKTTPSPQSYQDFSLEQIKEALQKKR